jgi:hypothetical protein
MSTFLILSILAQSVISVIQNDTTLPLVIDHDGALIARASNPIAAELGVSLFLTARGSIFVYTPCERESFSYRLVNVSNYSLSLGRVFFNPTPARSIFGIGPTSNLARVAGPIAVIRDDDTRAQLVLRSSIEMFISYCETAPISMYNYDPHSTFSASIHFGEKDWGTHSYRLDTVGRSPPRVASVPESVLKSIIDNLSANGATSVGTSKWEPIFVNCTRANVLETSPAIKIKFENGTLTLSPNDYLYFDISSNRCSFRIVENYPEENLWIDPLMLLNTNVRISSDGSWDLCESGYLSEA